MEQIIAYKPECGCKKKTFRTKSAMMKQIDFIHYPKV